MEMIEEVAKQIPALAVLVFLVIKAMGYMRERDKEFMAWMRGRDELFAQTLREIGADGHAVQREATSALKENTKVLGGVQTLLGRMNRGRVDGAEP